MNLFPKNPTKNPKIIMEIPIKLGTGLPKILLKTSLMKKNEKNPSIKLKIMRINYFRRPSSMVEKKSLPINGSGCESVDKFN